MSQHGPVCPQCGERAGVRQLREAVATQIEIVSRARSSSKPPPRSDPPPGVGSGTGASDVQLEVGAAMQVLFELAGAAIEAAVVKPASNWWREEGQAKVGERRARLMKALQEGVDRHPELYLCARDDVVFMSGGTRAVATRKAVALLFKSEDARLMSMLGS